MKNVTTWYPQCCWLNMLICKWIHTQHSWCFTPVRDYILFQASYSTGMCVTVLGHRDGCYAGNVCSFLLRYLSKRRYLVRVCHAFSFSTKTIDIEKCVYRFVTTVVSCWNIASCSIWTEMTNGRWQAKIIISMGCSRSMTMDTKLQYRFS